LPGSKSALTASCALSSSEKESEHMSVSVEKQAILMSLDPLFQEAEEKGLWFFHKSDEAGEIWCSPEYLRFKHSEDEYVWAPEHWELRNPVRYMDSLRVQAESKVLEFNSLASRFGQDKLLRLTETVGSAKDA
jgi:hypothetical protein